EQGIAADWFLTLKVAATAQELARYPTTRDVWLPGGFPPVTAPGAPLERLKPKGLAATLKRLAAAGRRDFYEGGIAADILKDVRALGGRIAAGDLRQYRARVVEPLVADYRGAQFALAPDLTAGPSMLQALDGLRGARMRKNGPHADAYVAYATVLREAYASRLATMGATADHRDPSSTTHLNVVDRDGNMVALTQTLLSVFGSKVVLPATGILMNNGIMWFDPRPAHQHVPGDRAPQR
ncbi:MAG: gamma-glutamyltransferase, partial [Betaproteobacteria bacterium]|nr:gamma-glutamyltransferase [Betaproteobacteria bacterium]